ncbi:hypothetical protein HN832_02410 [archaeon]|jgi:hypothetical protein|nr:hypothetical protein [archaeon]MBT4373207.1 hypothetical protein [archaeon]MBT4531552.1 hypothetical protein [archaeon]MBT7001270.1 hypothetical protein [archaeon]MBT7282244.1 hypothetical protein [archaeon]
MTEKNQPEYKEVFAHLGKEPTRRFPLRRKMSSGLSEEGYRGDPMAFLEEADVLQEYKDKQREFGKLTLKLLTPVL